MSRRGVDGWDHRLMPGHEHRRHGPPLWPAGQPLHGVHLREDLLFATPGLRAPRWPSLTTYLNAVFRAAEPSPLYHHWASQ